MPAGPPPTWFLLTFYFSLIAGGAVCAWEFHHIWVWLLCAMVMLYGLFCFIVTADWIPRRRR